MVMVDVDGSSLQANAQTKLVGLMWGQQQCGTKYIHQKNQVNSLNGYSHDDSNMKTSHWYYY